MKTTADLKEFLDEDGRLKSWPSARKRKAAQRLALEFLIAKFESERRYSEKEVNLLLTQHHTFGDAALLRRELIEAHWFEVQLRQGRRQQRCLASGFSCQVRLCQLHSRSPMGCRVIKKQAKSVKH